VSHDGKNDLSDFSMMDLFRMEIETQVEKLSQGLLEVEQGNDSADILEILMRASHSIKGAARMVNVEPVVKIAHEVEDCFVAMQRSQINLDKKSVDALLAAVDLISQTREIKDEQLEGWEAEQREIIDNTVSALREIHGASISNKSEKPATSRDESEIQDDKVRFQAIDQTNSATIRITVDRLDRILNLAGKSLVQAHELSAIMPDFWQVKHKQQVIISQLNRLQEHLSDSDASEVLKDRVKSILGEANNLRHQYADGLSKLDTIDRRSSTLSDYLHREIMASRMRPISEILNGLPRLVRDFSRRLQKDVRLQMSGLYTLVDRHVLELVDTPIKHLVQNAIDHGIELPDERIAMGKNRIATLTLNVSMNAGMLFIVLEDDGRGVNSQNLHDIILQKGLATPSELANLDQKELLDFLFYPGFSTKMEVNEISGRGVGLDLVKDTVMNLNGSVQASSSEHKGMRFQLLLPLTISVMRVLLTTICGESYAFPMVSVEGVHYIDANAVTKVSDRYYVNVDSNTVQLVHANVIFEGKLPKTMPDRLAIVVLTNGQHKYGVVVEKTFGEQELSIHNLSPDLGKIPGISSAAILNSGALTLIIDVDDYMHRIDLMRDDIRSMQLCREDHAEMCELLHILVVDDSMTVRKMEQDLLLGKHYRVAVAEDGVQALQKIQSESFDILITDVDMPNMDGMRLINEVRYLPEYADMPILIISNREKSFIKQGTILDNKTLYYAKDQFSAEGFLNNVQQLSKLVVNSDVS